MALLQYFKLRDGLPDPKGLLTLAIPLLAISMANHIVMEATTGSKKCGPYKKYSPGEQCSIMCWLNMIALSAASSLVSVHFLTHGTGNVLKNFQ